MNLYSFFCTTLLLSIFSVKGVLGSDRRRREAREDRLELTQEQRENKREAKFRADVRKPRSPDLKDDKVDDLFLSDEEATTFMRDNDRGNYDESMEERDDRRREAAENKREDAAKSPHEKTAETRENNRERRYEL